MLRCTIFRMIRSMLICSLGGLLGRRLRFPLLFFVFCFFFGGGRRWRREREKREREEEKRRRKKEKRKKKRKGIKWKEKKINKFGKTLFYLVIFLSFSSLLFSSLPYISFSSLFAFLSSPSLCTNLEDHQNHSQQND